MASLRDKNDNQNYSPSENKISELESVRGIAALLVAIFHIPSWNSSLYDIAIIRNGYLMVQLFFVLSGFVIYKTYSEKIRSLADLTRFQFLRFGRLYPVHIAILLVFLGMEIAKLIAAQRYGINSPNSSPFLTNNWRAFIQQVFLLQAIGPTGNAETFNGPAWSISVEFYTYLIFGLIVLYAKRMNLIAMAAIASLSICALVSQNTFGFDAVFLCLTGFFIGCITAFFSANRKKNLPTVMPLLVLCLLLLFLQYKTDQRADIIIFPLTALLILSIANSDDGFLKTILRSRQLVWLGTISYSVYMTHTAVLWIFIQVYRVILKRPETVVGGKSVPQLGFLEATLTYIVVIALILIFSAITYRLIEAPLRSKSRKFAMQKFR